MSRHRSMMSHYLAALLLTAVSFTSNTSAQESRGVITGRIQDPSGAVLAGVTVRATNVETRVVASTSTNETGNFTLPLLLPGFYTVSAEITGFKKSVYENIQVRVADTTDLTIKLEIGSLSESVEVKSESPLLSTVESSLGQVVDQRRIAELATFGGNPMILAT